MRNRSPSRGRDAPGARGRTDGGPARLRGDRDFRLLWGGQAVSELGSQVTVLALPLVAVRVLHAGPFALGVLTALGTAAFLLVGLPAGAWVDRRERRRLMVLADVFRTLALASIPLAWAVGVLGLVQLDIVAFVVGCLTVLFDVAYQSYLPGLVGRAHVVEANAKLTASAQVARVAGPSLAGALVQAVGAPVAIVLDAASFAVSVGSVAAIGAGAVPPATTTRRRLRADIAEGLGFVLRHRLLRAIAATTATSNLFGSVVAAIDVLFLVRVLHLAPGAIGVVFAVGGVGGVAGALLASRLAERLGGARATLVGILCSGGALLMPLSTPGWGALPFAAGLVLLGFGTVVYNVNQVSFRQRLCPDALLGRMNATMRFLVWGVLPLGALAGGAIATAIGLRATLWLGAGGELSAVTWLLLSPLGRRREFPDEAAAEVA